ncbi:hypothetical protein SAMN05421784_1661 [Xenorhabdus koppenhoeferi]|uniref:Uncharacterized protein n=1 Tax=Xenorhabdus koppenhoeferi TaxID=351659 RepID=A0A1I7KIT4_9GAMM|nr:hypothetical protein SAMN05421784_1661 [Xenorhabdus koppenhoeferi]
MTQYYDSAIVIYAPGDSLLAVALHLEIQWVYI